MSSTVRYRFIFTFGANLFRSLISFLTGMFLARVLGPESYGKMAFLLGTFLGLKQVLDMGSSSAFFTFLSQKPRSNRHIGYFLLWMALQFLMPVIVIGVFFPDEWLTRIWKEDERVMILLAFAATFMQNTVWTVLLNIGESQRKTVFVQTASTIIAALNMGAMLVLWRVGELGLYAVFLVTVIEYLIGFLVVSRYLFVNNAQGAGGDADDIRLRNYISYCLPLVPYAAVSFAYEFADRWLLQNYGGSVEQAFYSVGSQFAAVSLIATTSILKILWKEVAEANHLKDHERTRNLFKKTSRILYFCGAAISGFLIPWTEEILQFFLGKGYAGGAATLAIMFLYPIHQSMGQIVGTTFYAVERVALHVAISISFMVASIGVTYFMLAPQDAFISGLGLGSQGLALKLVAMQVLQVNVVAFAISRILGWRFDWAYQVFGLAICLVGGWLAHQLTMQFIDDISIPIIQMAFSAAIYGLILIGMVVALPWIAGLTRNEIRNYSRYLTQILVFK